jgi:hypothetical protein
MSFLLEFSLDRECVVRLDYLAGLLDMPLGLLAIVSRGLGFVAGKCF